MKQWVLCVLMLSALVAVGCEDGDGGGGGLAGLMGKQPDKPGDNTSAKPDDSGGDATAKSDSDNADSPDTAQPNEPTDPVNKPADLDLSGDQKHGWSDAEVGWMVRMKMPNNMEMVQEVKEVKPKVLLMRNQMFMDGKPLPATLVYMPRYTKKGDGTSKAKITKLPDETVTVDGKKLKCKVVKTEMEANGKKITSKSWTCKDVPGWTVKTESDAMGKMQTANEVVEFKK